MADEMGKPIPGKILVVGREFQTMHRRITFKGTVGDGQEFNPAQFIATRLDSLLASGALKWVDKKPTKKEIKEQGELTNG